LDNKQIRHEGIVESVADGLVRVRILQASACAACKVASKCHTAEAKEKIIDVTVDGREAFHWQKGQAVTVSTSSTMAGRALLLGFGIPLLLMLAVLVAAIAAGCDEGTAALLMLASLIPYYISLWIFRNRIAHSISFQIETQQTSLNTQQ